MVLVEEVNDNNGSSSSNNNQQNSQESGRPDSRPSASPQSNFTQLTVIKISFKKHSPSLKFLKYSF